MHKRHEQDYPKETRHSSRVLPVSILVASLALTACGSEVTGEKASKSASSSVQQIETAISSKKKVVFFRGDLIIVNSEGESKVVVNPIIKPKHKVTESLDIANNYNFYYLITDSNQRDNTATTVQEVDLSGYDVNLRSTTSGNTTNTIGSSVITVSGKSLINSPGLFNPTPDTNIYGFNSLSFDYHTVGDTYYVSTQSNQVPVGVLLEGLAIGNSN